MSLEFLDATCSIISELYIVEDSLIINGLLMGTGNPADLQNSNHFLLTELTLVQDVLSRLSSVNLYFLQVRKNCNFGADQIEKLKTDLSSSHSQNTI